MKKQLVERTRDVDFRCDCTKDEGILCVTCDALPDFSIVAHKEAVLDAIEKHFQDLFDGFTSSVLHSVAINADGSRAFGWTITYVENRTT